MTIILPGQVQMKEATQMARAKGKKEEGAPMRTAVRKCGNASVWFHTLK